MLLYPQTGIAVLATPELLHCPGTVGKDAPAHVVLTQSR
jgi:hypothetical protein